MLQKHISSLKLSTAAAFHPPLSETPVFSSCLFKAPQSPLIGLLTHTWAISAHRVSSQLCQVFSF